MQTPLGPSQSVLIKGVSLFRRGCFICTRYIPDHTQCPHYSGCLYFKGVCKAGSTVCTGYQPLCVCVCVFVCVGWWAAYELYIVD